MTSTRRGREANERVAATLRARSPSGGPVVAMFVRNTFEHDARVTRAARALIEEGCDVVLFAASRRPEEAGVTVEEGITVARIFPRVSKVADAIDGTLAIERKLWRVTRRAQWLVRRPVDALGRGLNAIGRRTRKAPGRAAWRWGHDLRRVALMPRDTPWTVRIARILRRGVRGVLWPIHRRVSRRGYTRVAAPLAASLRPAVYHCNDMNTMAAGARARRRHRAPIVYDAHELWPHRGNLEEMGRVRRILLEQRDRAYSRTSAAVVTVNRSIAEHMERRYRLPRVDVVMNVPAAPPAIATEPLPDLASLPRPLLFYSGGIQPNRGLEEAFHALTFLPDACLAVMGPERTGHKEVLEKLAAELGISDRIRFVPPVHHTHVSLVGSACDLALILFRATGLSYVYSLPNKLFEALQSGLPVVASDLPELRRVVKEHDVGELVDPDDPEAIAAAVRAIVSEPDRLEALRRNARAAAREYTWERERERFLDVYRRLELLPDGHR